jgi:hypothetical protein
MTAQSRCGRMESALQHIMHMYVDFLFQSAMIALLFIFWFKHLVIF